MAYVIAEPCIDTKDNSCVEVCPVDCIHPTPDEPDYDAVTMLYIDPEECIDCDACVEACPGRLLRRGPAARRVAAVHPDQRGLLQVEGVARLLVSPKGRRRFGEGSRGRLATAPSWCSSAAP